jgi:hypothetical protein
VEAAGQGAEAAKICAMDAPFNRDPLTRRQLARRLVIAALAAPLLYVALSFPVE